MFPVCLSGDIDGEPVDFTDDLVPLLELLSSHRIKMTISVTAACLERFHRKIQTVHDEGHEIAGHGDVHMPFRDSLSVQASRLEEMSSMFDRFMGFRPRGFRAPYLKHNVATYAAIATAGLLYDSSRVCRDPWTYAKALLGRAYAFPIRWTEMPLLVGRYLLGRTASRPYLVAPDVVELPVFDLDDWFFLEAEGGPKLGREGSEVIARQWLSAMRHFRAAGGALFVVQAHPRRMHQGLLRALDEFITMAKRDGCAFQTLLDTRNRFIGDPVWRQRNTSPPRWLPRGDPSTKAPLRLEEVIQTVGPPPD